jgi:hypothetical protein
MDICAALVLIAPDRGSVGEVTDLALARVTRSSGVATDAHGAAARDR